MIYLHPCIITTNFWLGYVIVHDQTLLPRNAHVTVFPHQSHPMR